MLSAITTIHHCIGPSHDVDALARLVVREIVSVVPCDGCLIALIENKTAKVIPLKRAVRAYPGMTISLDGWHLEDVVKMKSSVFAGNAIGAGLTPGFPDARAVKSLIAVPIIIGERLAGVIQVDAFRENAFGEDDLRFVELMAREMGIATETAIKFPETRITSIRDGHTGLLNRKKFDVDIEAEVARSQIQGKPITVMMVDVDRLGLLNDALGRERVDVLLKELAYTISHSVRPLDGVYRNGGKEFAVILTNTDAKDAGIVADRLIERVTVKNYEALADLEEKNVVTVSIGVASFTGDFQGKEDLVSAVESALMKAKEDGMNRYRVYGRF